ncbi:hypothetical protein SAMN04488509_11038 [Aquimonas voraii]|uniref:Uncharacterized protein n=1 Tax=Aquimonas voraii TaxID=265719 RepID=A0A1G6YLD8_9GAMM|nr:hypothetical protein SAMN04488509_11038 [Aquimonas voraii]
MCARTPAKPAMRVVAVVGQSPPYEGAQTQGDVGVGRSCS